MPAKVIRQAAAALKNDGELGAAAAAVPLDLPKTAQGGFGAKGASRTTKR